MKGSAADVRKDYLVLLTMAIPLSWYAALALVLFYFSTN